MRENVEAVFKIYKLFICEDIPYITISKKVIIYRHTSLGCELHFYILSYYYQHIFAKYTAKIIHVIVRKLADLYCAYWNLVARMQTKICRNFRHDLKS